ncbi:NCS1 family nucleobase:cation symporter-1 [Aidingimonas halophila]|uniref:Nucleobase:cation symporter-1, NCS1 family n=1 Tax=Aidingimonas halophila TaxID=574349 RepID=A0A1H2XW47_9GAMM|nr:NCS1 family nucleobase:cation symporter-1 [Aidingimonas halophila]GHC29326.1 transport-related membrane protein [Aidingimonas halophila]SDW97057.1 nucleobase:cation symporter-1, NCS1 family [Aidingimonas halophila]
MNDNELDIASRDPALYNADLAPIKKTERRWGAFEIFNVWSNDIQSLFGYTLAASLFLSYGLNGWAVMAAIILAGVVVMFLVNLTGKPSVKYGIPFPVMVRASMGVHGANFPAMLRAIIGIFWYGVQTYFASTAMALLLTALFGDPGGTLLGLSTIDWISFVIVWAFQIAIFWSGIERIKHFLNWAGPLVYLVMIALMGVVWIQAGSELLPAIGTIFSGEEGDGGGNPITAFLAITGTMIAYFAAVVINFGDFTRFVRSEREMKLGNLLGLPLNVAFFSFIALIITAGTLVIFGETLTNPSDIVERVDALPLTIIAAITFFAATVGINLVANFIPPAYDLANLFPRKISFRVGGLITAIIAFFIGALWVTVISRIGVPGFVNALGAVVAPFYGIIVVDYYLVKRQNLDLEAMFSSAPDSAYYYTKGWNQRALAAFGLAALFSISSVWVPALEALGGYAWLIGAGLGGLFYYGFMSRHTAVAPAP